MRCGGTRASVGAQGGGCWPPEGVSDRSPKGRDANSGSVHESAAGTHYLGGWINAVGMLRRRSETREPHAADVPGRFDDVQLGKLG